MENPKLKWAEEWLKSSKENWIGGERVSKVDSEVFHATNPATGRALTTLKCAGVPEVEAAVKAARSAFQGPWKDLSSKDRGDSLLRIGKLIRDHHAELATLETLSNGKLYRESYYDDIPEAADIFDYYAGWTSKIYGDTCPVSPGYLNYTLREPVGVCALIVPWNFPLLLACWKLSACLSMGNTAIVKPAPHTSLTLLRLAELIEEAGILPRGVVNVVLGGASTGDLLTAHPGIDKVSFTGSTAVGKRIVHQSSQSNLKRVTLELGGKSGNIVFQDVPDVSYAMERSYDAMFSHKGEKCSEPTRLIVHESHYPQFLDYFAKRAESIRCGDPFDSKSDQGAQCTKEQMEKILHYIDLGKREGATLIAGGERDLREGNKNGFFIRPTVFGNVKPSMKIFQDEIFGPVLSISSFKTEDEAVELANAGNYGLAAGLWTADVSRAHRVAARLDAGMVYVNRYGCYDFSSPFGGYKQSGWGKEMGWQSLEAYTKTKSVWVKL